MTITTQLSTALSDRYRIERHIGEGGMATVYLAQDVKHDRKVALKVLRPELAAVIGAERFLNEIKVTANLQHPHILPLHDSGEASGFLYYVMPFVEGDTLRDKLKRERQLDIDEAVELTRSVAAALDYAHRQGVIHRDIKPENVLLHDGQAMIADFGIALAVSHASGTRLTETGLSIGTPHYMSPEQAMGDRELDARSDIYSLGAMLYEMLSGDPPYTGSSAQAIVAKVITEKAPPVTVARDTVPSHIAAAIAKALAKMPADRFRSAADFAAALVNPGFTTPAGVTGTTGGTGTTGPSRRGVLIAAGAAVVTLVAGLVAGRVTASKPPAKLIEFSIAAPDSVTLTGRCCGNAVALSPDGQTVVFAGTKGAGGPLFRRLLGRVEAEPIPGTDGGSVPFFSPDSRWLGFFADGKLRKVAMAGGPPIPIANVDRVAEASWGAGDIIVYGGAQRLFTVAASGGEPQPLTNPDSLTRHYAPSLLPDGSAALLTIRSRGGLDEVHIGVVDLETGTVDTLGLGTRATYANGYLVFSGADNTLLAQPFDPKRRRPTGQAVAILDGVTLHGNTTHEFALSATGGLVYQPGGGVAASGGESLRLASPSGRTVIALPGHSGDNLEDPAFSPDGRRIALTLPVNGQRSSTDVWILDRQQGTLERFTVGGGWQASWSRDGRRIAFAGDDGLYVRRADGTGTVEPVLKGSRLAQPNWLPDGKSLVFQANGRPNTLQDIGIVTLGDTVPRWLVATEFRERHPQVSPDGRWLAYASDRTGDFEVYVQPLVREGPRVQVSTEGGTSPRWSPDGGTLYYVAGGAIVAAARAPGSDFQVASRQTVVETEAMDLNITNVNWDIHPDGKEFLYIDQGGGGGARLVWILDWPELVREMATGR